MSAVLVTWPAELVVSSLAIAMTIASTHFAYPWKDDQPVLAWVAGYIRRRYTH